MDALLEQVLGRPDLPKLKVEIDHALDHEAARRQAFYDALNDGDRDEFINGEVFMSSPQRLAHFSVVKNLSRLLETHVEARHTGMVATDSRSSATRRRSGIGG